MKFQNLIMKNFLSGEPKFFRQHSENFFNAVETGAQSELVFDIFTVQKPTFSYYFPS